MIFKLKKINPEEQNVGARNAMYKVIGLFFLIGFPLSLIFHKFYASEFSNPFIADFIGALIGLILTMVLVYTALKDQAWLQPLHYSWALKRAVMKVYNRLKKIEKAAEEGNPEALQIMAFYLNAMKQMHQLEGNSHQLLEVQAQQREWLDRFKQHNIDPDLSEIEIKKIESFAL